MCLLLHISFCKSTIRASLRLVVILTTQNSHFSILTTSFLIQILTDYLLYSLLSINIFFSMYFYLKVEREREGSRNNNKKRLKGAIVKSHIWKFTVAKWMKMLYFETFVGWIKWFIIAIFSYYEPYEESIGDTLKFVEPTCGHTNSMANLHVSCTEMDKRCVREWNQTFIFFFSFSFFLVTSAFIKH